jgi:hypothetical protein
MARRSYPLVRAPLHPADEPGPRLVRRTEQFADRAWGVPIVVTQLADGEWAEWQNVLNGSVSTVTGLTYGFSTAVTAATTTFANLANVTWGSSTMGTGNVIAYQPYIQPAPYVLPQPPTPEEEAARAERRARYAQERIDRIAQQEAARTRARNTLMEFLTPEQRAEYEAHDHFVCTGSEGNRYRIERGSAGNVVYLDERGEAAGRLCAHPSMREQWLPDSDVALAQMLALMTDERNFVQIANVHRGRAPEFAGAVLLDRTS